LYAIDGWVWISYFSDVPRGYCIYGILRLEGLPCLGSMKLLRGQAGNQSINHWIIGCGDVMVLEAEG
jgi:hypothetical protein